jgi:hypothetical protein
MLLAMVATPSYGPFHPPVEISEMECRAVEALRETRYTAGAAASLGCTDAQLRGMLRFLSQKLQAAAEL